MTTVIEKRHPFLDIFVHVLRVEHHFTSRFIDTQITFLWKNGIRSWEDIYYLTEPRLDKIPRLNKKVRQSLIHMHNQMIRRGLSHAYSQVLDKYGKDMSYGTLFIGSDFQAYFEEYFKEIFREVEEAEHECI